MAKARKFASRKELGDTDFPDFAAAVSLLDRGWPMRTLWSLGSLATAVRSDLQVFGKSSRSLPNEPASTTYFPGQT